MIRVFICPECGKARVVSKFLKANCYHCGTAMKICDVPYTKWVEMDPEDRERLSESYRGHNRQKTGNNKIK
ncbi:DNA-directed RNA polymerase subunit M [Lacrimispora sp. NSJ-141]|uniref:DNA-directed RNA polymerase subunit M n=1 Tax=Lientehia hominis TaxID=2897778 RepID=A0AAP2W9B3_9FIRM|nr:DNA-directed RNA polymerase subunit M [Lientehia hominis]MCD2493076.1 DNA-directed RNA polymerase subunit M [Lientehia hominis]